MYINDFGVQEVNAYYGRKGGIRTANVSNYANVSSFASLMRRAAAQRSAGATSEGAATAQASGTARASAAAQANATTRASSTRTRQQSAATGTSSTSTRPQGSAAAHTHSAAETGTVDSATAGLTTAQGNGNVCCEQCHQTNQLMLQMMTRNLYTQSLGYPLTGLNTWTAYQSMAGMLGNSLFT